VRVRFSAQLTGESYHSTSGYVYSVLKKVPEYRCPLYRTTGNRFKNVVFTVKSTTRTLWEKHRSQPKTTQSFPTIKYPGGFGSLVKYPALVGPSSSLFRRVLLLRFCAYVTGGSYYSTR
jgi:hypothetical protein